MRLTILALPLALAACAAGGGFKSPADMTAAERCDNAALALALVEANVPPGSETVARARLNYALLCDAPLARPADEPKL